MRRCCFIHSTTSTPIIFHAFIDVDFKTAYTSGRDWVLIWRQHVGDFALRHRQSSKVCKAEEQQTRRSWAMSSEVIERGIISGRMPGEKEWALYFLELTPSHLHFFEGHGQSSLSRKHLRSTEIRGSDEVGEKKSAKKNIFNFYLSNADGKYVFQCASEDERDKWIRRLTKVRNQRNFFDSASVQPKPPAISKPKVQRLSQPQTGSYARDCRSSVSSTDSGFGPSTDGEVSRQPFVAAEPKPFSSTPTSADGNVKHSKAIASSHSDGGCFPGRTPPGRSSSHENFNNYSWFWDTISRADTEKKLQTEGKVGNFIVRLNAEGSYVMSVWRADAVHHYKIVNSGKVWKFERAAITAEGSTLVDLLDTYMKSIADKSVTPFGDGLHLVYDEPWNPPEVDMDQLSERLREEHSKSIALESSTSVSPILKSSSSNRPAMDSKVKKIAMMPPGKLVPSSQPLTSPKPTQAEGQRATTRSPIQKSESPTQLDPPVSQSQNCSKPHVKSQPTVPPSAATRSKSETDEILYENWTTPPSEEESIGNYENWTAGQEPQEGSDTENSEQIYENTVQRPVVPQKPRSKR